MSSRALKKLQHSELEHQEEYEEQPESESEQDEIQTTQPKNLFQVTAYDHTKPIKLFF